MDNHTYETFDNIEDNLLVRCLFVEDLPVELPDQDPFTADTFIWFVAKKGEDSWWSFAMSDDLTTPEEIIDLSDDRALDEMVKMAVYLGETWDEIMEDCPHCVAVRHRESREEMPAYVYESMMEMSDEKLMKLRDRGRWQAQQDFIFQTTGVKISLN